MSSGEPREGARRSNTSPPPTEQPGRGGGGGAGGVYKRSWQSRAVLPAWGWRAREEAAGGGGAGGGETERMGLPAAGAERSGAVHRRALPAAGFPGAKGRDPSWLKPLAKAGELLPPPLPAPISDEIPPADRSAVLPPALARVARHTLPGANGEAGADGALRFAYLSPTQVKLARREGLPREPPPASASLAAAVAAAAAAPCWQLPARMR